MKARFVLFCCLLIAVIATPDLFACSCTTLPLNERIKAKVIFVGEAVQARNVDGPVDATFEITESFTPHPAVGSIVAATNGPCGGIQYERGKTYLIYGHLLPRVAYGEFFEIGSCSGTRDADESQEEIIYVREWARTNPHSQNRLTGTLLDTTGNPISNVPVDLAVRDAVESRGGRSEFTDASGRFEFNKVSPGEYVLGINVNSGPLSFRPYPVLYFPGVQNRRDAAVIRIYASEQLDGFEFVLPDSVPTREISVRIRWWDDTPVTNAEILCRIGSLDNHHRETLSQSSGREGTAHFTILATDQFEIAVLHLLWRNPTRLQPPPETVPEVPIMRGEPGMKPQEFTLVIPKSHDQRNILKPFTH